MWIVAPDNPWRAMAIFVRCIDNTLAADVLAVGEIYEVMHINALDGLYTLSGLGRFTMARFRCRGRLLVIQALAFARPESPEEAELNNRKRSPRDIAADLELPGHVRAGRQVLHGDCCLADDRGLMGGGAARVKP